MYLFRYTYVDLLYQTILFFLHTCLGISMILIKLFSRQHESLPFTFMETLAVPAMLIFYIYTQFDQFDMQYDAKNMYQPLFESLWSNCLQLMSSKCSRFHLESLSRHGSCFFPLVTRTLVFFFSQHVWSCSACVSRRMNLVALQRDTTLNSVSQMFSLSIQMCTSYVYIPTCWFACLTVPTPMKRSARWFRSLRSWSFGMRSECPKSQFDHHGWYLKDERHVTSLQIWWFNSLRIWGFLCNMFASNWRLIKSCNFLSFYSIDIKLVK